MIDKKEIERLRKDIHRHRWDMSNAAIRLENVIGWLHDLLEWGGIPDTVVARKGLLDNFQTVTSAWEPEFTFMPMRIGKTELFLLDSTDLHNQDKQLVSFGLEYYSSLKYREPTRYDNIPEDSTFYPCKCGMGGMYIHEDGGDTKAYVDNEHKSRAILLDKRCGEPGGRDEDKRL